MQRRLRETKKKHVFGTKNLKGTILGVLTKFGLLVQYRTQNKLRLTVKYGKIVATR